MSNSQVSANLDALAAFPETLKRNIQNHDAAALRHKQGSEWSAVEVIGHLIDVNAIWFGRIQQMLSAERPTLAAPNVDESVQRNDYQNKQKDFLLITFAERRAELVDFLRGLKPMHFERVGIHPTRGEVTVADGIAILANHDRMHNEQLEQAIAAFS
jgi:hypothetical protein